MEEKNGISENLIRAAMEELEDNGISGISMRRVAEKCGVSCAAPYKHFANKDELLRGMYGYIKEVWHEIQIKILKQHKDDSKGAMAELCYRYMEFLTENPAYLTLILAQDKSTAETFQVPRTSLTPITKAVYDRYCEEYNVDELTKIRRIHAVRCMIYGSSLMFRNGDIPMTVEYFGIVKFNIDRILTTPI